MTRPLDECFLQGLNPSWRYWVETLAALASECLLPLFLLHLRRGQHRVPLASVGTALDAAGGRPLAGLAATCAVRSLAEACPEILALQEASALEPAFLLLLRFQPESKEGADRHRPARCAGVVAKGFSLALPSAEGPEVEGGSQNRKWRHAQGSFYADSKVLERELAQVQQGVADCLASFAKGKTKEGQLSAPDLLVDAKVAADTAAVAGANLSTKAVSSTAEKPPTASAALDEGVLGFVASLQRHAEYRQQVCHVQGYESRPPQFADFQDLRSPTGEPLLSDAALQALKGQLGIDQLFRHQAQALRLVLGEKRHLCLTTGTSSGKSLAFALPILEAFRQNPSSRAIVLFPTKALAQDQLGKLQKLFKAVCPGLNVCTFDGDTPKDQRPGLLRDCHVFLTNPDMLHFTILSSHSKWKQVLENLRYIVLDEAHVYRASFGSHTALLLRRFRRVLRHYGANPLFIACSATMVNAGPFFSRLLGLDEGEDVGVVDEDTAGRGERQFCLWNPPLMEEAGPGYPGPTRAEQNSRKRARYGEREGVGAAPRLPPGVGYKTRASAYDEAAWIVSQAMRRQHRTVCFLQVRAMVELVLQAANAFLEDRPDLQSRLAGYRAGYAAADRRRLERRLFTGELLGVVATNALELGIDIGDLDLTVHVGVPPTVASVWQQAGRAGRRGRPSAAVLVALDAPLEQHFCRHPDDFFGRTLDARLPDVGNPFVLKGHICCAAVELPPLTETDAKRWFGPPAASCIDELQREGRLIVQPLRSATAAAAAANGSGQLYRFVAKKGRKSPKEEVSLRDIDPVQFQVIVRGNSTPLETLDQKMTFMKLFPGAMYLNQQTSYFVEELDTVQRIAWVVPRDSRRIDYYTEAREHSQLILHGAGSVRPSDLPPCAGGPVVHFGSATVHWQMYGFRKKAKVDHHIMDITDLSLPPVEYATQAVWMDLPGAILQPVAQAGLSVDRGGLHALEHAMLSLAPLCCDVESSELSCQHTRRDADPNRYFLLLFENKKGGVGASTKLFPRWEELLSRAVRLIEECPCESGCPNCIVVSGCGEYNHGLDKKAARMIGRALGLAPPALEAGAGLLAEVPNVPAQRPAPAPPRLEVEANVETLNAKEATQGPPAPPRAFKKLKLAAEGVPLCLDLD